MLHGAGNDNGNKINTSNQQKNKFACVGVQHTFLYTSLPLFCTTKISIFLVTHYFLWRNCRMCSPKILLLVFLFFYFFFTAAHFHLAGRQHPHFLTSAKKLSCFFPTKFVSFVFNHSLFLFLCYLLTVDIKNNVEKALTLFFFFFLKVAVAMRFPVKNTWSCLWCHTCC